MSPVLGIPVSEQVEKAFRRVLTAIGEPWRKAKRGRKPKRSPSDYALVLFARSFYGFSYRTAAAVLHIPKTCLAWAFKRLTLAWVNALVERTSARLCQTLEANSQVFDSTGVSLSANGFKRKALYDAFLKLHALTAYAPKNHAVWIVKAKITSKHVHDVKPAYEFIKTTTLASTVLADKAYDAAKLYRLAFRRGLRVCMRQRKTCESRRGLRGRVWHEYNDDVYRARRGRVEAVFGGFANRYGSRLREKKFATQRVACLLWCVAHNVRTLAKVASELVNSIYGTVSQNGLCVNIKG